MEFTVRLAKLTFYDKKNPTPTPQAVGMFVEKYYVPYKERLSLVSSLNCSTNELSSFVKVIYLR